MKKSKVKKVGTPDQHFPTLLTNLSSLQSREKFTDVVFLCRGGRVSAHRAMLAPLSPLLESLFNIASNIQAADTVIISLPQVDHDVLKLVMTYIYHGECGDSLGCVVREMKDCAEVLNIDIKIKEEATTPVRQTKNKDKKGKMTPMTIVHEDALSSVGRSKRTAGKKSDVLDAEIEKVNDPNDSKKGKKKASKEEEEEEEYEVETIIEKREMLGTIQYLVKWKGWENEADRTWEPVDNLEGSINLVQEFERSEAEQKKRNASKRKSDIKFVHENGDSLSEVEESPKEKSTRPTNSTELNSKRSRKSKEPEVSDDDEEEVEEDYEVEKILKTRKIGKRKEFLIKWKGWEKEEDMTWETAENLEGSKDLLEAFLAENETSDEAKEEKPAPKSRKGRKSSPTVKEKVKDTEPEVVQLDDSDTETCSTPKTKTKKKGKGEKVKKPRQTKRRPKPESDDDGDDQNEEYEVEKILKKRQIGKEIEYQVKWKGWENEEDLTWEPLDNLSSSSQLIEEFESQNKPEDEDVALCEEGEDCQRIFTSKAALSKHSKEAHFEGGKNTKAAKKSYEDDTNGSSKRGKKRGCSPRVGDEDEPTGKRKPSEEKVTPKYKPGPKSKKKSLNPWLNLDRESPEPEPEPRRLDRSDSEDEGEMTGGSSGQGPAKTFDDLFGGGASDDKSNSNNFVFNKDSDDESDGGNTNKVNVNVEELIGGSDNEDENVFGLDWQ